MAGGREPEATGRAGGGGEARPSGGGGRRLARGALWVAIVVVVPYGVFLGALNGFLNLGVAENVINRRPERWTVHWTGGWAWVPWQLTFRNVEYARNGRSQRMAIELDRATVDVDLAALADRRFRATRLVGHGLAFALTRREPPPGDATVTATGADERPNGGAAAAPADDVSAPSPEPDPESRPPGWRIDLESIEIADFRELALFEVVLRGGGSLSGSMSTQIRGELAMPELELDLHDFRSVARADDHHGTPLEIRFRGQLTPFRPRDARGWRVIRHVEGSLELEGEAPLQFLSTFLRRATWVEGIRGHGHVTADAEIAAGRLRPGSRMDVEAHALSYAAVGLLAEGTGSARLSVPPEGGPTELAVLIDGFGLRSEEIDRVYARGERLGITATSPDPDLALGFANLDLSATIERAELVDLSLVNQYLPRGAGIAFGGGSATLGAELHASTVDHEPHGRVDVHSPNLELRLGDLTLHGDLDTRVVIAGGDLLAREFLIDGSRLRLDDIAIEEEEGELPQDGGWLEAELQRARLGVGQPLLLEAELSAGARDTRVLMAFFVERKRWAKRFAQILTIHDLQVSAGAYLRDRRLDLKHVQARGKAFELLAELTADEDTKRAILYAKFHGITFGLETGGGERDLKVFKARRWYEERLQQEPWASRR